MFELMTMALKVEKIVIILALCKGRFFPYRDADTPFVFSLSLAFKFRSPTTVYNYLELGDGSTSFYDAPPRQRLRKTYTMKVAYTL